MSGGNSGDDNAVPPLPKSPSARIRLIEKQEVAIRGLRPLHPVKVHFLKGKAFVSKISRLEQSGETPSQLRIARIESVLTGEIPPSTNLRRIIDSTLPQQVIGLYDYKSKQLFVKDTGQALGIDRYVVAHEYTHAMQDQHFHLAHLEPDQTHWKLHNSDEELAVRSLIEGDAVDVQYAYIGRYYNQADRVALFRQEQSTSSTSAPRTLQEQFDFPYTTGPAYVTDLLNHGGYANVNYVFRHPPATTYQLLFPESHIHVYHLRIKRVLGPFKRWHAVDDDVNGAFGYQQLVELYVNGGLRSEMATLWRGDRYLLLRKARQYALLMESVYSGKSQAQTAAVILKISLRTRFGLVHAVKGGFWAASHGTFSALVRDHNRILLGYGHSKHAVNRLVRSAVR